VTTVPAVEHWTAGVSRRRSPITSGIGLQYLGSPHVSEIKWGTKGVFSGVISAGNREGRGGMQGRARINGYDD